VEEFPPPDLLALLVDAVIAFRLFRFIVQGVGQAQNEDPLSSVRSANFLRRKESERTAETASRQVLKDSIKAE
jgi:hypothetical protein